MEGRHLKQSPRAMYTSPMIPSRSFRIASRMAGQLRPWVPCWHIRPYRRAAATSCRPSQTLCEQGFSTYTSLPARIAAMATSEWVWFGVAMPTASMFGSSTSLR